MTAAKTALRAGVTATAIDQPIHYRRTTDGGRGSHPPHHSPKESR